MEFEDKLAINDGAETAAGIENRYLKKVYPFYPEPHVNSITFLESPTPLTDRIWSFIDSISFTSLMLGISMVVTGCTTGTVITITQGANEASLSWIVSATGIVLVSIPIGLNYLEAKLSQRTFNKGTNKILVEDSNQR